jgi:large subunit ribosomal protein L15
MRLHDLKPAPGAHRERKRLGRGNATGQGTTAGKGTKGEKARSGGMKAGFRGMSSRNARMPKRRGFTNPNKIVFQVVNLADLETLEPGQPVTAESLLAAGLVSSARRPVKILGKGELTKAFTVQDIAMSASARAKIEAAGGSVAAPAAETAPQATASPAVEAAGESDAAPASEGETDGSGSA